MKNKIKYLCLQLEVVADHCYANDLKAMGAVVKETINLLTEMKKKMEEKANG